MIGCTSPLERIDSVSSASSSSRKSLRGLSRLGRTSAVATMRCWPSGGSDAALGTGAFMGPLRLGLSLSGGLIAALALDDLGRELDVGLTAGAVEIVEQDRLAVRRRLGHANVARDDRLVDLGAEEGADVVGNFLR